ncbi:MAG: hypothetical protein IT448_10480 [Phycisphaerales bacterium]|nr:hypothetical protein [Phycisphaerales bacterium]
MTLIYRKQTDNPNNVKIVYFRGIPADKDDTGYTGERDESILRWVANELTQDGFGAQSHKITRVSRKITAFLLVIIRPVVLG